VTHQFKQKDDALMAREPKKLDELFHDTLKDIYFAEKKILSTLPKMAKAAQSEELKAAFEKHYTETEGQIERLEKVFALSRRNRRARHVLPSSVSRTKVQRLWKSTKGRPLWTLVFSAPHRRSNTTKSRATER
jgi:Domain of unknown function (DUF892)